LQSTDFLADLAPNHAARRVGCDPVNQRPRVGRSPS
jgi:hypothetical protein